MPLTLFPIFCTSIVPVQVNLLNLEHKRMGTLSLTPLQTLTELLESAYAEGPDSPDSLLLVLDKKTIPSAEGKNVPATVLPVSTGPGPDFYGATIASLVAHVQETAGKGPISGSYFLVVDQQTPEDKTVLLVKCPKDAVERDDQSNPKVEIESLRLATGQANAPVVAMQVGSGSFAELEDNVAEDGVYRGGKGPSPKEGQPAPRKKLGGEN
ncbi:hypothetical protein MGN70_000765 [Eutypa lata]|nr:hypothetical protein MGN70_000765 [Eutypa lata]